MSTTRIPDERRAEAVMAYLKYRSIRHVAYVMCMGVSTARRIAREAGVLRPQGHPGVVTPSVLELRRLRRELGSIDAVATAVGCSASTVRNRLRAGVSP